jgi:methionyl-tRNA formyltransferase
MSRVLFMGTPSAAVPTLELLVSRHDVGRVITRPDRPIGRSRSPSPPPVKTAASRLGVEVSQPRTREELLKAMEGDFDVAVVVAYGRILSSEMLALPGKGFLNVHFSLLPRWRGAAPVARALMAGDTMTGVSIIRLDEGLDTGPVLTAQAVDVGAGENAGELTARLAGLGARLLVGSLDGYLSGEMTPVPQTGEGLTYADKIEPSDRPLDPAGWTAVAVNKVRGLAPEPGATLEIDGVTHQILSARPHPEQPDPGTWRAHDRVPVAGFGDGGLELVELLPPGKRVLRGEEWLRGRRRDSGLVA